MSLNDKIKKYIVKISYSSEGSGVIVNTKDDRYFYILTAKHTFFTHTDNEKMDVNEIIKEKIKIIDSKGKNILLGDKPIETIIGIEKKYDFLILVIKKDKQINVESLSIYEDDFKECKICGYPNSKINDDNKAILLPCNYNIRHEEKYTYEVNSNILLETLFNLNANENMKGISGSGVFVESATGKLYLAGIQIQTASHNSLVCLDIRILAREINEALKHKEYLPIEIDGYALKEELGIDTSEIDFTEMLDKLKDDELDEFKDKSHKKIIEAFNGGIKQKLDEKSKELAKKYLYLSLLFHKEKDNRRSTIYFKKAVKNNPSYYALFLKVKDERKLTDKEKEKYNEINSEVSNSDISADDLFFEMLEDKLMKLEDFDEKEGVYMQILGLFESKFLDLKRESEDTTEVRTKIDFLQN
jgi:tetratricopeptide (TPR) repeat protein